MCTKSVSPFSIDGHLHYQLSGFFDLRNWICVVIKSQPWYKIKPFFVHSWYAASLENSSCASARRPRLVKNHSLASVAPKFLWKFNNVSFQASFWYIVVVQSLVSVLPRSLCTSFWTGINVSSDFPSHAQVFCATTKSMETKVCQLSIKTAVSVQLEPTCMLMKIAV